MSDDQRLHQQVRSLLDGSAPSSGPADLLEDVFAATTSARPRPSWLARLRQPPMRYEATLVAGSPSLRLAATVAVTALLVAALAATAVVGSRLLSASSTYIVAQDGSGQFRTIAAAVAEASDGDTILVRPGTYPESVLIQRDITLRGEGDPASVMIAFPADSPTSRFIGNGIEVVDLPTGLALRGSDARVEGLTIRAPSRGLAAFVSGGDPTLIGVRLQVADGPAFGDGTPPRVAFVLTDGSTATVRDSVWDGWAAVRGGASAMIRDNTVTGGTLSITGPGTSHVVENEFREAAVVSAREDAVGSIEHNDFVGAYVKVFSGADVTISDNTIVGALGDAGIMVAHEGTVATLERNTVRDSDRGVLITSGARATLRDNTVCGNVEDLTVLAAPEPLLEGNEICGAPA